MQAVTPLTPGRFALEFERLCALAAGLTQIELDRVLATIETEQHHAILGDVDPTLLRDAIEAAAVLARLAPLRGRAVRGVRGERLPQDDSQPWHESTEAQPARTKRGVC
jgi:hypothetical protein